MITRWRFSHKLRRSETVQRKVHCSVNWPYIARMGGPLTDQLYICNCMDDRREWTCITTISNVAQQILVLFNPNQQISFLKTTCIGGISRSLLLAEAGSTKVSSMDLPSRKSEATVSWQRPSSEGTTSRKFARRDCLLGVTAKRSGGLRNVRSIKVQTQYVP